MEIEQTNRAARGRARGLRGPRRAKLEKALAAAFALFRGAGAPGRPARAGGRPGVDVVWVADGEMRALNRRFARGRGTTDVLAFEAAAPPGRPSGRHLGEVVCNLELAGRCARRHGHTREAEAVLYATHGLLHLLGARDGTRAGRCEMRLVELGALRAAGLEVRGGEWEETRQRQRITAKHAKDGIRGGCL